MACVCVSKTLLYPGMACVGVSSSLPYPPHPLNRTLPYETNLRAFGYFHKCGTVFYRVRYGTVRYIHLVSPERTLLQYKTEKDFCAMRYIHLVSPEPRWRYSFSCYIGWAQAFACTPKNTWSDRSLQKYQGYQAYPQKYSKF